MARALGGQAEASSAVFVVSALPTNAPWFSLINVRVELESPL